MTAVKQYIEDDQKKQIFERIINSRETELWYRAEK